MREAKAIHDELYVKVFVFEQAKMRYAIAAYDLLAVDHLLVSAIKAKCEGLGLTHIFFSAIHTHSGPAGVLDSEHGFLKCAKALLGEVDKEYIKYVAEKTTVALKEAISNITEGIIKTAYGSCGGIGSNRNNRSFAGNQALWIAEASQKSKKALIVNFACHPTILKADNLSISSDFCGAYAKVMKQAGYSMCLFLNGSCGDISSRFTRQGSDFCEVERMGNQLAQATIKLKQQLQNRQPASVAYKSQSIILQGKQAKSIEEAQAILEKRTAALRQARLQQLEAPKLRLIENEVEGANADYLFALHNSGLQEYQITVEMLKIGKEIFIGIPGELFSELSNSLEDEHTHFISYVNGYHMYFANAYAYEQQYYEALSSPFAKGESERMMNMIVAQIKKWRK